VNADEQAAGPPPWTGPWADDARRLFQLVQTAAEQLAAPPEDGESTDRESTDGESTDGSEDPAAGRSHRHPPECLYCPFCQGVALLRRAGPDVLDQLSEFAAGLAATLRATDPAPGPPAEGAEDPSGVPSGERGSTPARPPSTVRIDVTD
jgi:hypothetical protein